MSKHILRTDIASEIQSWIEHARNSVVNDSHALFIFGEGGSGKSELLTSLPTIFATDQSLIIVGPLSLDDPQYWNVKARKRRIIDSIPRDVRGEYFNYYLTSGIQGVSDEASERVYFEAIQACLSKTKRTLVILLDTAEAVRNTEVAFKLAEAMKRYQRTLFIVAGRPPKNIGFEFQPTIDFVREHDRLYRELAESAGSIALNQTSANISLARPMLITGLTYEQSREFLKESQVRLHDPEVEQISLLCNGNPLWLSLAKEYIEEYHLPPRVLRRVTAASLERLHAIYPNKGFHFLNDQILVVGDETEKSQLHKNEFDDLEDLRTDFQSELLGMYLPKKSDPRASIDLSDSQLRNDIIRLLSVIRKPVDFELLRNLLSDRYSTQTIHSSVDWDKLWRQVTEETRWIKSSYKDIYITLQDAFAQALHERFLPLVESSDLLAEREPLWRRAQAAYSARAKYFAEAKKNSNGEASAEDYGALEELFGSFGQYYLTLSDPEGGIGSFLKFMGDHVRGNKQRDYVELVCIDMQRLLDHSDTGFESVVQPGTRRLINILHQPEYHNKRIEIHELILRHHIIQNNGYRSLIANAAERLANELRDVSDEDKKRDPETLRVQVHARLTLADAYKVLRQPFSQVEQLLEWVASNGTSSGVDASLQIWVRNYLGLHYRKQGDWQAAQNQYRIAYQLATLQALTNQALTKPDKRPDRQLATVANNYAYVISLRQDNPRLAELLIEQAVSIRERLHDVRDLIGSHSTRGEIYRHAKRFLEAWNYYSQAATRCREAKEVAWLGVIRQEQAACLFDMVVRDFNKDYLRLAAQLAADGIGEEFDVEAQATATERKVQILEIAARFADEACNICKLHRDDYYPPALNRSGRICRELGNLTEDSKFFVVADSRLKEAISTAKAIQDTQFWSASIIELGELRLDQWQLARTSEIDSLVRIQAEIQELQDEFAEQKSETSSQVTSNRWELWQSRFLLLQSVFPFSPEAIRHAAKTYLGAMANLHDVRTGYRTPSLRTELDKLKTRLSHIQTEMNDEEIGEFVRAWNHVLAERLRTWQAITLRDQDDSYLELINVCADLEHFINSR